MDWTKWAREVVEWAGLDADHICPVATMLANGYSPERIKAILGRRYAQEVEKLG